MGLLVPASLVTFLLVTFPSELHAADARCGKLQEGSLSRIECENLSARERHEREIEEAQRKKVDINIRTIDDYVCKGGYRPGIRNVEWGANDLMTGTYRNVGPSVARGVRIYLMLYDDQDRLVGKVGADVFPGTLAPGDEGTFKVGVPVGTGRWSCFKYFVTVIAE